MDESEQHPGKPESAVIADPSGSDGPRIGLRVVVALIGAALCALGVVAAASWLIAVGIAALVTTSIVPDHSLPLPNGMALTTETGLNVPLVVFASGTALVAVSVGALFNRFDAGWPLATWLLGLALVLGGALYRDATASDKPLRLGLRPSLRSFDTWMLAVLTIAAFAVRLHRIETLPPMHGDEGEMGMLALRVGSDEYLPPFTTLFLDHPTLFHYLQKLSMMVFGESVSGLRLGSAIFGALTIPAIYLVGRLGWSRRVGMIAAAVLAFSHVHIQFSRMALNNVHSVIMAVAMIAALLWADRSLRARDTTITPLLSVGLACGLAQFLYFGSRLLPVILAIALLIFAWRYRGQFARLLLVPFGFFLAWLPIVPWFVKTPGAFSSRQTRVGVFSEINAQAISADGTWGILISQAKRNLRFFIDQGDVSTFYFSDVAGLSTVTAILFWVGLGLALAKAKHFPNALVLIWFVSGFVLGGMLTTGAPSATRLIMIFPAIAILAGIAVDHFVSLFALPDPWAERTRSAIVVVLALVLALAGTRAYFQEFAADPPRSDPDVIGRDFARNNATADTFLLGAPALFAEHGTLRFTSYPDAPRNLLSAADLAGQDNAKPLLFVVAIPQQEAEMTLITQELPGGDYQRVEGPSGQLLYFSYLVDH